MAGPFGVKPRRAIAACGVLLALAAAGFAWQIGAPGSRADAAPPSLADRVAAARWADDRARIEACNRAGAAAPLKLLVLGQSNAGNHGQGGDPPAPPLALHTGKGCMAAHDPLPGGTGRGASIWPRLPEALSQAGVQRPLLVHLMAVDATTIADWNDREGPLGRAFAEELAALRNDGFAADLVLWQQGEADALRGTPAAAYSAGLAALADTLRQAGQPAPVLAALSTRCGRPPDPAVRSAIETAVRTNARFKPGPDTDAIDGPALRLNGCHFTAAGLDAAARAWAPAIAAALR